MNSLPIHSFLKNSLYLLQETNLPLLSFQNKKIVWIAAVAFACLAFSSYVYSYLNDKQITILTSEEPDDLNEKQQERENQIKLQTALLTQIHSCQATKSLYQLAEKTQTEVNGNSLKINIFSFDNTLYHQRSAFFSWRSGIINLNSNLPYDRAFSKLVLELANATQVVQFRNLKVKFDKKELSHEEFAFSMEQIEYTSILLHTTTIKDAIAEKGITWRKYDIYHYLALDEEAYLNKQIDRGHTALYLIPK